MALTPIGEKLVVQNGRLIHHTVYQDTMTGQQREVPDADQGAAEQGQREGEEIPIGQPNTPGQRRANAPEYGQSTQGGALDITDPAFGAFNGLYGPFGAFNASPDPALAQPDGPAPDAGADGPPPYGQQPGGPLGLPGWNQPPGGPSGYGMGYPGMLPGTPPRQGPQMPGPQTGPFQFGSSPMQRTPLSAPGGFPTPPQANTAQPLGSPAPTVPGGPTNPGDLERLRTQAMFSPTDPAGSVMQAMDMLGLGVGARGANPFLRALSQAAQSLASAYIINQAQNPGVTGQSMGNMAGDFGEFLMNAIRGGNVFSEINQARGGLGGALSAVQAMRQAEAGGGGGATAVNPFTAVLRSLLEAPNNQGGIDLLGTLNTPFMPAGMRRSYMAGLEGVIPAAVRNFPMTDPNADFQRYILGL